MCVPEVDSDVVTLVRANPDKFIDKSSMLARVSFSKERLPFVSHSLNKIVMLRLLIFPNDNFGCSYLIFLLALFNFLFLFRNEICPGFYQTHYTLKRLEKTVSKLTGHLFVCVAGFFKLYLHEYALVLLPDKTFFFLFDLIVLNQFILALLTPQILDTFLKLLDLSVLLSYHLLQEVDFAILLVREPLLKALVLLCELVQLMQDSSKASILFI